MGLIQDRKTAHEAMLKGTFINHTLKKYAQEIDREVNYRESAAGFRSAFWKNRNFETISNTMVYKHLKQHRFIDMRRRQTQKGVINKKAYPHHNRVLFGEANNLIKELSFGFIATVKEEMEQLIKNKNL